MALASAAGAVQTSYGYDPYGVTSASGTANTSPYQFAGRENDRTGLCFSRARYYNPTWGRFISEDPSGIAGGLNLYAYATNNPVGFRDPTGNGPIGRALGGWAGAALAGALGIETGPFDAAIAAIGRAVGSKLGSDLEDWLFAKADATTAATPPLNPGNSCDATNNNDAATGGNNDGCKSADVTKRPCNKAAIARPKGHRAGELGQC